jgi:Transposase IS66 family
VPFQGTHNNICERALKKAILHRKNALFYKTQNGAQGGICSGAGFTLVSYTTPIPLLI